MQKNVFRFLVYIIILLFYTTGCGRTRAGQGSIVASINGEPIYVKDLKREIALSLKRDPMFKVTPKSLRDQLNILINRRLLVQEARRLKLDQTERFVNTIKTFWEQTLIRDLMLYKEKELDKNTGMSAKQHKQEILNKWLSALRLKADIQINDRVLEGFRHGRK